MSFSLKREVEFYVNDVDSTDGACKLAVLPEFSLKLESALLQVYRKELGNDPEMLPRTSVDQISPVSLEFLTYIKPAMLDGYSGTSAPEKLLFDSLGGVRGYRDTYYKPQFGRVNRLIPLYIFIKTSTAIYKVNSLYITSLELSFDIKYILIAKWIGLGISLEILSLDSTIFTNIKDYSNIDTYLKPKFTSVNIKDYDDNKIYEFPIIESSLSIQNVLTPLYDKNIKITIGVPKDIIVGGRSISGTIKCYLSGAKNKSKEFLKRILDDVQNSNRKYRLTYTLEHSDNEKYASIEILLPRAILNIPNIAFEDVLEAEIQFTSSEKFYGSNDDIEIKYNYLPKNLQGDEDIVRFGLPFSWFKLDEPSGSTAYDSNSNKTGTYSEVYSYNNSGPGDSTTKSIYFNNSSTTANFYTQALDNFERQFTFCFWAKKHPGYLTNATSLLKVRATSNGSEIAIRQTGASTCELKIYFAGVGENTQSFSHTMSSSTWSFFCVLVNFDTKTVSVYVNGTLKVDSYYSSLINSINTIRYNQIGTGYIGTSTVTYPTFGTFLSNAIVYNYLVPINYLEAIRLSFVQYATYTYSPSSYLTIAYNDILITYSGNDNNYYKNVLRYNPYVYWRFNDNNNTYFRDHAKHTSYGYHIVPSVPISNKKDSPLLTDSSGNSVTLKEYNGSREYLDTNGDLSNIYNPTFIFWAKIDGTVSQSAQRYINTGTDSASFSPLCSDSGLGKFYAGNGAGTRITNYFTLEPNIWYHVAVRYTYNSIVDVFINGVKQTATATPQTSYKIRPRVNYTTVAVGQPSISIAEYSIFSYNLSDESIQGIYQLAGYTGFNFTINPSKKTINIRKYIPSVNIGINITPIAGNIQINNTIINIHNIRYTDPNKGRLLYIADSTNIPIISKTNSIFVIKNTLNVEGNIPTSISLKSILPTKGSIRFYGKVVSMEFSTYVSKGSLSITKYIPRVIHPLRGPTTGQLSVAGHEPTISVIANTKLAANQIIFI